MNDQHWGPYHQCRHRGHRRRLGRHRLLASLLKRDPDLNITLIEPSDQHYYQPAWTLVGGGAYDVKRHRPADGRGHAARRTWMQAAVTDIAAGQTTSDARQTASGQLSKPDRLPRPAPGLGENRRPAGNPRPAWRDLQLQLSTTRTTPGIWCRNCAAARRSSPSRPCRSNAPAHRKRPCTCPAITGSSRASEEHRCRIQPGRRRAVRCGDLRPAVDEIHREIQRAAGVQLEPGQGRRPGAKRLVRDQGRRRQRHPSRRKPSTCCTSCRRRFRRSSSRKARWPTPPVGAKWIRTACNIRAIPSVRPG